MLRIGNDFLALDSIDCWLDHSVSQVRISPTHVLEVTPVEWHSREIKSRTKLDIRTFAVKLGPHGRAPAEFKIDVPRGPDRQARGE